MCISFTHCSGVSFSMNLLTSDLPDAGSAIRRTVSNNFVISFLLKINVANVS